MQTTLDIDRQLLAEAETAAARMGQPISAILERSLKLFLKQEKCVLQVPQGGYRGGSLERDDAFFVELARIEKERHARQSRTPIRFD